MIELIVVIVIIGILAVVAVPAYSNLQANARLAAARGSLGAIRSAISIRYAENVANNANVATNFFPTVADLTGGTMFSPPGMPINACNALNTVTADGAGAGWGYTVATGTIFSGPQTALCTALPT